MFKTLFKLKVSVSLFISIVENLNVFLVIISIQWVTKMGT